MNSLERQLERGSKQQNTCQQKHQVDFKSTKCKSSQGSWNRKAPNSSPSNPCTSDRHQPPLFQVNHLHLVYGWKYPVRRGPAHQETLVLAQLHSSILSLRGSRGVCLPPSSNTWCLGRLGLVFTQVQTADTSNSCNSYNVRGFSITLHLHKYHIREMGLIFIFSVLPTRKLGLSFQC